MVKKKLLRFVSLYSPGQAKLQFSFFVTLRFYVKSNLAILGDVKLQFFAILKVLNFDFWENSP